VNKTALVLFTSKLTLLVTPQDIASFSAIFSISETFYIKFPEIKKLMLSIKDSAFIRTFAFIIRKSSYYSLTL
jgi:hypothetical protein